MCARRSDFFSLCYCVFFLLLCIREPAMQLWGRRCAAICGQARADSMMGDHDHAQIVSRMRHILLVSARDQSSSLEGGFSEVAGSGSGTLSPFIRDKSKALNDSHPTLRRQKGHSSVSEATHQICDSLAPACRCRFLLCLFSRSLCLPRQQ